MKKMALLLGGALLLVMGFLPGCGSEPEEYAVVSEEVSWDIDDTTVYATVTRPETGDNHPAVVFIAGSGPTDRDWNSPLLPGTNGSAKLLAEELAKKGYVTIRYDKRVSGDHAAENVAKLVGKISMQAHLDELKGAVDALVARDDVDSMKIFALGNSEGTIHAVNYQLQAEENKFAGLILTGAPGQSTADVMRAQIAGQLAGYPGADEIMRLYDEAVNGFIADGTMDTDPSLPEGIITLLQSFANPLNMPFTQELLTANIADDIDKIDVPVLVLIGKKDIQVDWQVDGGKLQAAAEGMSNIEFAFPENASHVLKYEEKPKAEINLTNPNYNGDGTVLDSETLDTIITWLDTNT